MNSAKTTKVFKAKLRQKEKTYERANTELLLPEESGFLESDYGEKTTQYQQREIARNVDITSASKLFNLDLQFGPYCFRYSKNGRHLVLGGKKGHVAAFDWIAKKLSCEINVMESVHDVCWLHTETMFAVSQKKWVYIYDNQGIELHCLKKMEDTTRLEFLPYHFLLASSGTKGHLTWLDVSIGEIVAHFDSKIGRINVMTQNPGNATLCVGTSNGCISMWSPNSKQALAKMLCHKNGISACAVHPYGTYMATTSPDRYVKVWDVRQLVGPVHQAIVSSPVQNLAYSQKGLLGVGMGNVVEVFKESSGKLQKYMRHTPNWNVSKLSFCPYEDVLGIGTAKGFTSMLVPGAGEPNFDGIEANPFQTKQQRTENEVKLLLGKINHELITLDPKDVCEMDVSTPEEKAKDRKKILRIKPKKIGTAKIIKSKKALREIARREARKEAIEKKQKEEKEFKKEQKKFGVLSRFLPQQK